MKELIDMALSNLSMVVGYRGTNHVIRGLELWALPPGPLERKERLEIEFNHQRPKM